jgi:hypothetical protein
MMAHTRRNIWYKELQDVLINQNSASVNLFSVQCHHISLMDFVVSLPGCDQSVTDIRGWDAHEAQLRCPHEVDGDI